MPRFAIVSIGLVVVLVVGLFIALSMRRPFEKPEFVEIKANETAFVAKLDGKPGSVRFDSAEALQKMQVSTKRIPIAHVFESTGRWPGTGHWKPGVAVYVVDRSPVTREWSVETNKGTANKDEGIWVESKDSVGFSTGITISAMIEERNAALFLYRYPAGEVSDTEIKRGMRPVSRYTTKLDSIMDNEIRSQVQAIFSDFAARYDMSDLRERKVEIAEELRKMVIPYFADRGIKITNIGLMGGFLYENPKIQDSIDKVFVAQREKEVNKARLEAQTDANKRIELEAKAVAEALRTKAQAEADAILMAKGAEAEGQRKLLAVAKEAGTNPAFIRLRQMDVDMLRAQR